MLNIFVQTGDYKEDQVMSVDASRVYAPPDKLQVPDDDVPVSNNSDSALSAPDSDDNDSEASSSPTYAKEPPRGGPPVDRETGKVNIHLLTGKVNIHLFTTSSK